MQARYLCIKYFSSQHFLNLKKETLDFDDFQNLFYFYEI